MSLYHPGKWGGGNGDVIVNLKYQELLPTKALNLLRYGSDYPTPRHIPSCLPH